MMIFLFLLAAPVAEQCVLCHPEERVQFEASIHAEELIRCTDCHGGDAEAVSVEPAHRNSFTGSPSRGDIPTLCAKCHSDPERMRPYNLPIDQLALYQTSSHGILLSRGREDVAVCTDCHGTHSILRARDPESRVFVRNIPATCGRCHSGSTDGPNVYQDYLSGVHGRELLENSNTSAPDCALCHGVHGATPAGVGDVSKICGNCHSSALQSFRQSRHFAVMADAGLPECMTCHESHSTHEADSREIAEFCLDCHERDSTEFELATKMEVLFARAGEELTKAETSIDKAREVPLYVEDYLARLEQARTYLLEAEPAIHTVSIQDVERFTRQARSVAEEIEAEIEGELGELQLRRVGLIIFWFYLLLTVWILNRYRQNAMAKED